MENIELVRRVADAIEEANRTNFTVISFPNANWIAEACAAIFVIRNAADRKSLAELGP